MSLFTIKTSLYVSIFSLLILTINAQLAGTWPKLDSPPPPKAEWTQLVDMSKVPAAPLSKFPGDCGAKDNFCNWSCSPCVRTNTTDIIQCPNKYDWGLTFDDGPTKFTDTLLDYLSSVNTTITFFVVGSRVTENPQILKKAVDAGHQIGVHTWSHTGLTTQTNEEIIAEMKWTELAIQTAVGLTPKYMRPPFGDVDDRVRGVLSQLGYKIVIWDKDTKDYVSADVPSFQLEWIEGNFTQWVQENDLTGHISLEHDLYQQTAARAPKVVPILQNANFTIKPVALCVGDSNPYLESTGAVPAKAIVTPSATATETASTQSPANESTDTDNTPMSTMSASASTSNSLSNVNPHMNNNYYLLSLIPFIVASIII